jgi:7-cyano-7-deazaguanine synthase
MGKKAVVLVSGGLDSTTCLAIAKKHGFELYALTLFYGQRHEVELKAARKVSKVYRVKKHLEFEVPLTAFGGSSLTDKKMKVPKKLTVQAIGKGIPSTYVPARNTVFLSLALAWAEVLQAEHIFIGVNALDYSGYPDCRPEFIQAFERLATLATKKGVEGKWKLKIHTPLIRMSKAQIIKTGLKLKINYGLTHSCYDPKANGAACGRCDSCLLREKGFQEAGVKDPIRG